MVVDVDYTDSNDGVTLFSTYDTGTFAAGKTLVLDNVRANWTSSGTGSLLTQQLAVTVWSDDVYPAGHTFVSSDLVTNPDLTIDTSTAGHVTRIYVQIRTRWSGGGAYSVWGLLRMTYEPVTSPFGWSTGDNCT